VAFGIVNPSRCAGNEALGDAFVKVTDDHRADCVLHGGGRIAAWETCASWADRHQGAAVFEVVTTFALVIGLVVVTVFQPGVGMNATAATLDAKAVQDYASPRRRCTRSISAEYYSERW